ncbi:ATP-binding protein [Candidatus Palauibacter sp.]|uniref:ATP-binding protein n=1 Tax=Candidatus Palauibacter sp. TaxID=3101350 RepID=UPI003B51A44A
MNTYERPHVGQLVRMLENDEAMRIIAITGPRQTGKTTIALQARRRLEVSGRPCWYVPLDDPTPDESHALGLLDGVDTIPASGSRDERWLVEVWESARRAADRADEGLVLVLDEIQHTPRWSNVVKGLWDGDRRAERRLRVVLLGSAPWHMLTGLHESLLGRFNTLPTSHWSLWEMARAFGLTVEQYLFLGGYPGALSSGPEAKRLAVWRDHIARSIIAPAIDRDIVGLARVTKPALMRQFMELAPHYSGQLISFNKLLGQLQDAGNTTTVARYLNLLSDAGLVTGLSRYTPAPHLGKASSPKLNVLNTALMTAPSAYTLEEARTNHSYWGRLVESAVGAHLFNTRATGTRLHYWRDPPHEVDFVLARGPRLLGIEAKSGRTGRPTAGLDVFADRFPHAETRVVGTGGVPLNEFLSVGAEEWLNET